MFALKGKGAIIRTFSMFFRSTILGLAQTSRRGLHGSARLKFWFLNPSNKSVPTIYKARQEPWLTSTIILLGVMPIFTFALGTWQLKRLKWKINLIDELEEKLHSQPLQLPPSINLAVIPEFVYRRVLIRGRWDYTHTMLLSPRVREGVHGVHVVTPLIRENGSTVLVDRGFVSRDFASSIDSNPYEGEVEVLGMLRTSQPRNRFTPDNKPSEGLWYWTDVEGMAESAGGEQANVQPVFVEHIFEGHAGEAGTRLGKGIPIGRAPTVDLRNSHLSYVITWYALSGLTGFMFTHLLMKKGMSPGKRLPRFG